MLTKRVGNSTKVRVDLISSERSALFSSMVSYRGQSCQLQRRDNNPGAAPINQGGSSVFKDRPIVNTNIDVPIIGRGFNDGEGFRCQRKTVVRRVRWSVRARMCFGTEGDLSRGVMIG